MGNVIPFDGTVADGEAMVNQASLTGESLPVRKVQGSSAYAGTVVEEGEVTITVKAVVGSSRFEKSSHNDRGIGEAEICIGRQGGAPSG